MKPERTKAEKHEGGVRKYLRRTPLQRLRQAWVARRLGACGQDVFLEPNVRFLRHPENIRLGAQVIVKEGARLCTTNPEATLSIGDWTTIGYHTYIFANRGVSIGRDCLIAPFCYIVDTYHGFRDGELIRKQPMSSAPVVIEDDVWIGTGVRVFRGVTIGRGAVIGAGSIISSDVPPNAIVHSPEPKVTGYRR